VAWADRIGPVVRADLKAHAPVAPENGGRLRDSIRYTRKTKLGSVAMTFTAHTPYAGYVLHGTPPHIIQARAARTLRYVKQGQTYFRYQVHHPGTKPNPFPKKTLETLIPEIRASLAREVGGHLRVV
jgi:HK97 gp10 family phage protein